jgi:hypothetical protein
MSTYETHIGSVDNSVFAIGENAKAKGIPGNRNRDDIAQTLRILLDIASKYNDPVAREVKDLTVAANSEIRSGNPERDIFRRLTDATRKMMDKLGPGVIEAGALADAVVKISDLVHHW